MGQSSDNGSHAAPKDEQESRQDTQCAEQSQFLADHRVDQVRVGGGKEERLLVPLSESDPQQTAAAERDPGLLDR